ncbi:hypothetical protein FKW77_006686 [Venturia effusa]|uniref:F-box domain-containing protein n=1 Tax=Venturia effusa TaxID=50376 RepID=A0A517LN27_9PEZI|nr:hypothetical protein FKW77_006686 [Venturia effusa]
MSRASLNRGAQIRTLAGGATMIAPPLGGQGLPELKAPLHFTTRLQPTLPQWLRTSNSAVQDKGTEMISLPQDSPFARIPVELQLSIILFLPYTSVLSLKNTNRYFHYFVTPSILAECRQLQIARFAEQERNGGWADEFPCYACLRPKYPDQFYSHGVYAPTTAAPGTANTKRHCITCSLRNNEYEPGTCLTINGQRKVLCANCGELAILSPGTRGMVCIPCEVSYVIRRENGLSLRFAQLFFTIVSWALACSGKLVPRTSIADRNSVRFILQSTLSLITLSATCNSILIRGETKKWQGYRTKRQQNGKFVFRVELAGFICWTAVLAGVLAEGTANRLTGRFDKIAKAMVAMLVFLCISFAASARWAYKTSLVRKRVVKKFGRVPEVLA